jgi:type IV pilus assembly protein PilE
MPTTQFLRPRTAGAGFTLTQLLVTIAIVAILATVGYPSYQVQIEQTRRAEMQAELLSLAQFFERRHAETGCYNAGPDADCTTAGDAAAPNFRTTFDYYTVGLAAGSLTADTFTLIATPTGSQAGDGELHVDQAQRRFWDENDDGDVDDAGEDDWKRG